MRLLSPYVLGGAIFLKVSSAAHSRTCSSVCMHQYILFELFLIVLGDFLSANKQTPDFKTHKKALTKESGFELNNKKSHFLVVERAELYSKGQKKALTVPNLRKCPKYSCHIRDLVPFYLPYIQIFKLKMGKKGKQEVKLKQIQCLDSMQNNVENFSPRQRKGPKFIYLALPDLLEATILKRTGNQSSKICYTQRLWLFAHYLSK